MAEERNVGEETEPERLEVELGTAVYDRDGQKLGTVQGYGHSSLKVSLEEGYAELSEEHVRSEPQLGEANLMWRCSGCGEMGEIEGGLPDRCPNCDAPREDLMYWTED